MAETQVLRAGRNVRGYLSCPIFNLTLNPSLKLPLITSLTEIFIVLGDSVLPYRIAFWITFCSWKVLLVSSFFSKGSRNLTFYNFHQWLQFCTGKLHGTKTNKQKNLQAEQPSSPLYSPFGDLLKRLVVRRTYPPKAVFYMSLLFTTVPERCTHIPG